MDKARQAVVHEARELLLIMEQTLARVAADGGYTDSVNELFRVVHTIKGSAALFAFERLASFAHLLENMLDGVRDHHLDLNADLQTLLLECSDYMAELVDAIAARREETEPDPEKRLKLEAALAGVLTEDDSIAPVLLAHESAEAQASSPVHLAEPEESRGAGSARHWRIDLRFNSDILRSGMDPAEFLRVLASLGKILEIRTRADTLPAVADFDPETCYLEFSLLLAADCTQEEIDNVFEFVRHDSDISVQPREPDALQTTHGAEMPIPDFRDPSAVPPIQDAQPDSQAPRSGKVAPMQAYVKVPVDRLDSLIDMVGELVLAGAAAQQVALRERNPAFLDAAQAIETLVAQIRGATLNLRMIPIGEIFQRFPRVVRSVARQLGKEARLTMAGAETELDKSMMEKLSEPLMHIVRNAIDHGLETPRERLAAGKPAAGVLHLAAYHDAGSMVVEVSDDGRGLDYERIRRKAVERGLLAEDETITEDEASRLLFEPGFSTRGRATRLSGRGVGMDVVRQRIESLRGETEILSTPGRGTLVRLRLPLTLAIIDGFLVMVGDACFVIPMDMMVECIDIRQHEIQDSTIDLRGESLPCLRLRDTFGLPPAETRRESMVVVQYGRRQRAGLIVDWLAGELQVVIKPLGMLFDQVGGLSGSTILGDGRVALILDIPQLIQKAAKGQPSSVEAANQG